MIYDPRPVARPVIHKWPVDNRRSGSASASDLRRTVVSHGSLDRSFDGIGHEGVIVPGRPIRRPLERPLDHVGYDRVIAILGWTFRFEWILHDALRCASRVSTSRSSSTSAR